MMRIRGGKERRSLGRIFIIAAIALWVAVSLFNGESPPPASVAPSPSPVKTNTITADPGYALRPTENTWPKIDATGSSGSPLTNLLTENYYVVLDGSGSMQDIECSAGQSKMEAALKSLKNFHTNVPGDANFGLAIFNSDLTKELVPLTRSSQTNIDSIAVSPRGSTPLFSAVKLAYGQLTAQGKKQLGYGRYHLIIITDGIASKGEDPTVFVQQILRDSPVNLHTIGFCIGSNHSLNQPGRTVYHAADNPAELSKGLDSVLAEAPQFDLSQFGP